MTRRDALARDAAAVNARLRRASRGRPHALYRAAHHLIASGGKRLRPHLALECCEMLGGARAAAMPAAAAIEMVHNFTLVHDDIMDNDPVRHGVSTVHSRFGLPVAILAGDVLFSGAFAQVSSPSLDERTRARLLGALAPACVRVCEGQMMDIAMAARRGMPARAEYVEMVEKKTSALFEAACAMGAISAGASERDVRAVSRFGRSLGVAFQITDDIIGAMGDPGVSKKPVGNDIREGKKSLPILLALRSARGADARAIRACLGHPRASAPALRRAVAAMRDSGAEAAARAEAARHAAA
ncbi:MAG: polyprenyl synthetase family protein, partial [Thaumarchaeota archaeon]|nr:polyprenyl synthetase family protein [Nitrososphaerota archaeon]